MKTVLIGLSVAVIGAAAFLMWPRDAPERASAGSESYAVELEVEPRRGPVTATVRVTRHDHAAVDVDEVVIEAVMPSMGHAMPEVVARRRHDRFEADGELFTMTGLWDVSLRLDGETATVRIPVVG
ncbi:hypothetical protein FHS29_004571 [Saccharothrix tamanrassetensis]|uniref:YtkA-like domain-containing protein n=1 Tax=Saccharothrix tamanrassetensis TaxID=1051531 RepID=A0A841CLZ8_9PSEU|nr:FixH family protein [Saccharothrix tamanrassetensis]MBB5957963.1 hypothetical protein [Saccharothrix tamanrassetensis]